MNNHTPGPWMVHTLPDGSHHVMAEHWGASVAVTMYPDGGSKDRESNARLIAAAPDLLKALQNLERLSIWTAHASDYDREQIKAARAAIAKATGGNA